MRQAPALLPPVALVSGPAIAPGATIAVLAGACPAVRGAVRIGLVAVRIAFLALRGAVQRAYNRWKWPLMVFHHLGGGNLFHPGATA